MPTRIADNAIALQATHTQRGREASEYRRVTLRAPATKFAVLFGRWGAHVHPKVIKTMSDDDAMCRIRGGNRTSYELLAARYDGPLHRVARRLLRSEADADDVVQRAHLLALTHIDQFRGSGYFRWMYSIVVNEARTDMRKRRRIVPIDDTRADSLFSSLRNPEQQAVDRDVEEMLERAMAGLPSEYQAVFRMREIEDLTTAETAERLGLSNACVKTRLFRARNIMRTRLTRLTW